MLSMRLIGYDDDHGTHVGCIRPGGKVRNLGSIAEFWSHLAGSTPTERGEELDLDTVTLVPPILPGARVLCVGLNYRAHAAEGAFEVPSHPTIFGRWAKSLTVSGTPAPIPRGEEGLDWEGELAVVVGRTLKDVTASEALGGVFGYASFNDLTARRVQHHTTQWTIGKNADQSGPLGPIATVDEVRDPAEGLRMTTRVNGEVVQDGSTRDMIFGIGEILSYLSGSMTLHPGDVIATGTVEGVGYARNPPWLLQPGDEVEVDIEQVGVIRTPIVAL
jgi:2,4-didehydro-3-deoxy-L-rhamnonate hydrolase